MPFGFLPESAFGFAGILSTKARRLGRRLSNWVTTRDAINSVWYQSADQLVARSRDIIRKDGWASKAVDEWVCNAIGTGLEPLPIVAHNYKPQGRLNWLLPQVVALRYGVFQVLSGETASSLDRNRRT